MIVELFVLVLLFCLLRDLIARDHGLPPGDGGLPFIGTLPRSEDELHKNIFEQKKKYGNLLCIKIRCKVVIVLTEFKLIKSIFMKLENLGRFQTFSYQNLDLSSVIVGIRGFDQKINIRNSTYQQRVPLLESVIRSEIETLIKMFSMDVAGTSINITRRFNIALLNIIWNFNDGKAFKLHDGDAKEFFENVTKAGEIIAYNQAQLDLVPWLKNLLPEVLQPKIMSLEELENTLQRVYSYIGKIIGSHKKTFDCNMNEDLLNRSMDEESLTDNELLNMSMLLYKLILRNSKNTTASIFWFLLYVSLYPEVQEKIHEEIDAYIPRNRFPLLSDRNKLPFLNATIHEVNRCSSSQPSGMACLAVEDTMFSGFKIPKGSLVHPHVESCHSDPKYFENPDEFRPSRFLSEDGSVNNQKEGYLPFYLDRGPNRPDSLCEMETFLFISSIMQRFKVSPKEIGKLSIFEKKSSTKTNNIIFIKRI